MTGAGRRAEHSNGALAADPAAWDAAVLASGGHLLQSWRWGAFKEHFGWKVARIAACGDGGTALAQILFRTKAGMTIGYIPRGPVVPTDDAAAYANLWGRVDEWARRERALTIIVEPDNELPKGEGDVILTPGAEPIQPSRTVKTGLRDDDGLMAQMHPKTRYNVRMARRREVTCRIAEKTDASVDLFYGLLQDTASRNAFVVHDAAYYGDFLRLFGDDALLMFAEIEDRVVAGVIAVAFGPEAIYMYGASSTRDRANGAGFLIQYEAMRWARDRGALRYDMWGIPEDDPESSVAESGDRLASSHGGDWRGIYEFKVRFGGEIVRYPRPLERRYHPLLASIARRFYSPGGAA